MSICNRKGILKGIIFTLATALLLFCVVLIVALWSQTGTNKVTGGFSSQLTSIFKKGGDGQVDTYWNGENFVPYNLDFIPISQNGYNFRTDSAPYTLFVKQNSNFGDGIRYCVGSTCLVYQAQDYSFRDVNGAQDYLSSILGVTGAVQGNKITYVNAFPNVDWSYENQKLNVKEKFLLKQKPQNPQSWLNQPTITLDFGGYIKPQGLHIYVNETHQTGNFVTGERIEFRNNQTGEVIFYLPKPVAEDNAGAQVNLKYEVKLQGNNIWFYTRTPWSWLNATERVYPVHIHPHRIVSNVQANISLQEPEYSPDLLTATFKEQDFNETITEFELKSHSEVTHIKQVGIGRQVVMYYDVQSSANLLDKLNDPSFIDMRTQQPIQREWKYVYLADIEVQVPTYHCFVLGNGTQNCEQNGTEFVNQSDWLPYEVSNIPSGEITLGVEVKTENGDLVDGVWNIDGNPISEHAVWNASLQTGLVSWYKLYGNLTDEVSGITLTNDNTVNTSGKIDDGRAFDSQDNLLRVNTSFTGTISRSFNVWVMSNDTANYRDILVYGTESAGQLFHWRQNNNGKTWVQNQGTSIEANTTIPQSTWVMVTMTFDGTTARLYQNASLVAQGSIAFNTGTTYGMHFGSYRDTAEWWYGKMDEIGMWNRTLTQEEITNLYNDGKGCTYLLCDPDVSLQVDLLSPSNGLQTINTEIVFSVNVTDSGAIGVANVSLLINGIINQTNSSGDEGQYNFTVSGLNEGNYNWTAIAFNSLGSQFITSTRTFLVDFSPPVLILNQNLTDVFSLLPMNVTLNYTATDLSLDACFYNTTDNPTPIIFTCNTVTNVSFSTSGTKTIFYSANDTLGGLTTQNVSFSIGTYTQSQSSPVMAEGGQSTFTLILNKTNIGTPTATFTYNNTNFVPTTQVNQQNGSIFTYVLNMPAGWGNSTGLTQFWNWTFSVPSANVSDFITPTQSQVVYSAFIDNCVVNSILIFNFTHMNEEDLSPFNFSSGNNLEIDVVLTGLLDPTVSLIYHDTKLDNQSIEVCINDGVLNSTSFRVDLTGSYIGTDYVQEFFYIDNGTLTSSNYPQNYFWYDLALVDSTTFLFKFLNENGLPVPGAIVETLRYYIGLGEFIEVERSKIDNNGETHIHLVEEDAVYKFRITFQNQEIFISEQYNAKCLSSPCSITLSAEPDVEPFPTVYNNLPQGSYLVQANKTTREVTLLFNLNETATMNMSIFTSNNNQDQEQLVAQGTTTASSGQFSVEVPLQYGNTTYYAVIYHNDDFVATRVVDLSESAQDYFGALGLFLGALAVLVLIMIGASHGEWVIIWAVLGLVTVSVLVLVDLNWYALLTFIAGAGIFMVKLISRRRIN